MNEHDKKAEFERLYILWRFGDAEAGSAAIALGRALTEAAELNRDSAPLFLKLGLLLHGHDPEGAQVAIDQARDLGAPIPRVVARADESQAPAGEAVPIDKFMVIPPSARRFPAPSGDPWHPSFDLVTTRLPALEVSVIEGGWLSVDTSVGLPQVYAYTADRRLVPGLSSGAAPFLGDPIEVPGTMALLDDAFGTFNVSHALFDKFPRLAAYEKRFPGEKLTSLMFLDTPYYRDAVAHLGHGFLAPEGKRWTVKADRLALLSNHRRGEIMHPAFSGSELALDFIRRHLQSQTLGGRRLYVSREDADVRRLVNEREVAELFSSFGFEVVTLTGMDFQSQRDLFAQAAAIAGVHGAGLANLVFAAPGAKVFEIMPPLAGTFAYWVMAGRLGQAYCLFTAEDAEFPVRPGASYDPSLASRPIRADVDRLRAALTDFLA